MQIPSEEEEKNGTRMEHIPADCVREQHSAARHLGNAADDHTHRAPRYIA
ncbi:hypothetical protein Cenrod_1015 [Candidatus Symbiobacter mobilis CR]|uniref:Uncharacterized protein n=1 Tax=Candidatus Symbiobacter mobilis CR TaxID=946483 RepID=U5NA32_9BURK|nr:hypothetical protein Cenrod_1015 [Candidatus Symbiobacter mobilis CR]